MGLVLKTKLDDLNELFSDQLNQHFCGQDKIVVGLVGGRSIKLALEKLDVSNFTTKVTHFFWGDERCVPLNSSNSNYFELSTWIKKLNDSGIPERNIHPFKFDDRLSDYGLAKYQQEFDEEGGEIDILFLSSGEDGHVLSLFPNHSSIRDNSKGYINVEDSPKPPSERISMSRELAKSAKLSIIFFIGSQKKEAYKNFLDQKVPISECPAKIALDSDCCIVVY